MNLKETIKTDLILAMKDKNKEVLNTLRAIKGAVQMEIINNKKEETDELYLDVINKQIKMRKDSIREFENAGRSDLAEQNQKEIEILNQYMPEQLSESEIEKIIEDAFQKINPTSQKQMGLIMKEISPQLKGKADMGEVNKIIKSKLENI